MPIKASIACTQNGIHITFPDSPDIIQRMMPMLTPDAPKASHAIPLVYWLRLTPQMPMLRHKWEQWKPWVQIQLGAVTESTLPLHCTMTFDAIQSDTDYEEYWSEQISRRHFHMIAEDIYVGSQGAAAAIRLPDQLSQWFQFKNSVPHVSLMMVEGHESHELGPMMRLALQVQMWTSTSNPNIHISADKQFIRIGNKTGDQSKAEGVYLDDRPVTQMSCSPEQDTLLQ